MTLRTSNAEAATVRVVRRVLSEPNHAGHRTLIGRPGETLTAGEARRRGLSEGDVEPVGVARVQFAEPTVDRDSLARPIVEDAASKLSRRDAVGTTEELVERDGVDGAAAAHVPLTRAELREASEAEGGDLSDLAAADDGAGETSAFPEHRGGPNWRLSDGSTFRGSRDGAAEAEAALAPNDADDATDGGDGDHDQADSPVTPTTAESRDVPETADGGS